MERKKFCKKCKNTKIITDFYKNKISSDGYTYACKTCYYNQDKQKQYYNKVKSHFIGRQSQYNKTKYYNNEEFRITQTLRTRLKNAVNKQLAQKYSNSAALIGCSSEFLVNWLDFNKSDKVTETKPHIDHLIPCSSFNLLNETEQKKCFNWRNLRYLNAKDNLQKSNKKPDVVEVIIQDILASVFEELYLNS